MVKTYGLHRRLEYVVVLILGLLAVDQLSKFLIQKFLPIKLVLIENILWLTYVENFGAGFGILQGQSFYLGIFSIIVSVALLIYMFKNKLSSLENTAIALIIAGGLGNAIDRLVFGYVVDFIDLGWWPVFNIADSALVIGVFLLVLNSFISSDSSSPSSFKKKKESNSKTKNLNSYK
jgi:signal peptidase II